MIRSSRPQLSDVLPPAADDRSRALACRCGPALLVLPLSARSRFLSESEFAALDDKSYIVSFDDETLRRKQAAEDGVMYIDAAAHGNMMRLFNDDERKPNCEVRLAAAQTHSRTNAQTNTQNSRTNAHPHTQNSRTNTHPHTQNSRTNAQTNTQTAALPSACHAMPDPVSRA